MQVDKDELLTTLAWSRDTQILATAPLELCDDRDVIMAAMSLDWQSALIFASERLRQDRDTS
eukprot:1596697-Amphidinium_carterae.1